VTSDTSTADAYQIVAYAAAANGQLTPVPGSPFSQNVNSMVASSAYLLAAPNSGSVINTYTIGSNGALTLGPQFNYAQIGSQIAAQIGAQGYTCSTMGVLAFDRTGQNLYAEATCSQGPDNLNFIASFAFNSSNGTLTYLGDTPTGTGNSSPLVFLGNDEYAYQVDGGCLPNVGEGPYSFARSSSGLLTQIPTSITEPPTPPGATSGAGPFGYVAVSFAADNTNHLAAAEASCFFPNGVAPITTLPVQLAAYTDNPDGSMTTTDTDATMPTASVIGGLLAMSPSGTLLAVAGPGGMQIFHFNGASSVTSFTGVLTTDSYINQMAWDNSNHLYALDPGNNVTPPVLHVFTVTDSGATEAPGSPYALSGTPTTFGGLQLAVSSQSQ
jgi:hypothetical protein